MTFQSIIVNVNDQFDHMYKQTVLIEAKWNYSCY